MPKAKKPEHTVLGGIRDLIRAIENKGARVVPGRIVGIGKGGKRSFKHSTAGNVVRLELQTDGAMQVLTVWTAHPRMPMSLAEEFDFTNRGFASRPPLGAVRAGS